MLGLGQINPLSIALASERNSDLETTADNSKLKSQIGNKNSLDLKSEISMENSFFNTDSNSDADSNSDDWKTKKSNYEKDESSLEQENSNSKKIKDSATLLRLMWII